MTNTYQGMFLVDNDVVRAGWQGAKTTVVDLIQKHGGTVHTARRWDERKLAYPIKRKKRGTYLLSYYEIPPASIDPFLRDLEINETVLRYLVLGAEEVPEEERTKAAAEAADDFIVPAPPEDDAPEPEPEPEPTVATASSEKPAAAEGEQPAPASEEKAEAAPEAKAEAAPEEKKED